LGHEIQGAVLALRRIQEHLLIQPLDVREVEALGPFRKEEAQKFGKELAHENLEALIVIFHLGNRPPSGFEKVTLLPHPWSRLLGKESPQALLALIGQTRSSTRLGGLFHGDSLPGKLLQQLL